MVTIFDFEEEPEFLDAMFDALEEVERTAQLEVQTLGKIQPPFPLQDSKSGAHSDTKGVISELPQPVPLPLAPCDGVTPLPCDTEKTQLGYWGLPECVVEAYRAEGITELYPWQVECLEGDNVLQGQNLVYSAPTSSGKSLVAEILMLRKILMAKKRAIVILPFISVVTEKERFMKRVYSSLGLLVDGYYANHGGRSLFAPLRRPIVSSIVQSKKGR
jgi:ATP-dependent helicase YprA (DUF1998 family)